MLMAVIMAALTQPAPGLVSTDHSVVPWSVLTTAGARCEVLARVMVASTRMAFSWSTVPGTRHYTNHNDRRTTSR